MSDETAGGDVRERSVRARRGLVYTLTVVAAVTMVFASVGAWAKRQALNTDNWVDATDELLDNDEVRGALSQYLVDQLYQNVDIAAVFQERLPNDFQRLAPTVAAALRQPSTSAVDRLLATDQVRAIWERASRRSHEALVAVLRDETRAESVSTAGGTITLDLGELVRNIAAQLGVPDSVIARIPPDAGQIVIAESDELEAAQNAVTLIDWASVVLFVVVVALFAAAVIAGAGLAARGATQRRHCHRDRRSARRRHRPPHRQVPGRPLRRGAPEPRRHRRRLGDRQQPAARHRLELGRGRRADPARRRAGRSEPPRPHRPAIHLTGSPRQPGHACGAPAAVLFLLLVQWAPLPLLETWYGALIAAVVLALAIEAFRRVCEHDAATATDEDPRNITTPQPSQT